MTINEIQDEIIDEFSLFDDWMDKYQYLIDLSKNLPVIDEKYKTEENLIKGCQSQVWLAAEYKDGKVFFTADSDAIITKIRHAVVIGVVGYVRLDVGLEFLLCLFHYLLIGKADAKVRRDGIFDQIILENVRGGGLYYLLLECFYAQISCLSHKLVDADAVLLCHRNVI